MKVYIPIESQIAASKNWGTWSKEPSVFPWHYDEKESCYILEGEASVKDEQGNEIQFKAGDMVEFEQGLTCEWNITKAIRKKYIFG